MTLPIGSDIAYSHDGEPKETRKCVTIVFNPVSGQGDPEARKAAISEALAAHGYECQNLVTTKEQGARFFAEQAVKDGVDLLAVSGGDGTVVEAMTALLGTNIPLAIFPAGTGNLLSLNLNLPHTTPEAAKTALFGKRQSLDLAKIIVPGEEPQHFAILAGVGYDALVIRDADRETKNRFGPIAYLFSALKNLRHRPMKAVIRLDDSEHSMGHRAKSVMIANMGQVQGNLPIVPGASPNDGLLNVAVLKAESLTDWVRLAWSAIRRKLHEDPSVVFYTARKIEVHLSRPEPMQFDGEESKISPTSFTIEILPDAVEIMVPQEA